jgi:hypothetical protein
LIEEIEAGQSVTNDRALALAKRIEDRRHQAQEYVEQNFAFVMPPTSQSYEIARVLVSQLLAFDADAVKKIRQNQFTISKITSKNILEVVPQFDPSVAQALEQQFAR